MSKFKQIKLIDIAASGRSVISGPFGSNIGKRFFQESGVPIIRGNNLTTDSKKFVDEGFVYLSEEKADELNSDAIEGDILFTAAGTIGQVGMIPRSAAYKRYVISNKQLRFRVDPKKANSDYVYYWLASPWIFKTILNKNTGSTVPLINLGIIKSLPISLPEDVYEQEKIANVISKIDSKIELNNLINAELEAMAKTLYDYWFVQFDFPFDFAQGKPAANGKPYKSSGGKMVYNPILKREIPEGWDARKLGEVISLEYGKPLKTELRTGSGFPVVGSNGVIGFHAEFLVKGPGIVVGRKGTVGAVTFLHDNFFPIDTTYFVQPKIGIKFYYLKFLLDSLGLNKMNSDSAVPGLNREAALRIPIVGIPEEIISFFEKTVMAFFKKLETNNKENEILVKLRDWLLPMLMNGQVTVK